MMVTVLGLGGRSCVVSRGKDVYVAAVEGGLAHAADVGGRDAAMGIYGRPPARTTVSIRHGESKEKNKPSVRRCSARRRQSSRQVVAHFRRGSFVTGLVSAVSKDEGHRKKVKW